MKFHLNSAKNVEIYYNSGQILNVNLYGALIELKNDKIVFTSEDLSEPLIIAWKDCFDYDTGLPLGISGEAVLQNLSINYFLNPSVGIVVIAGVAQDATIQSTNTILTNINNKLVSGTDIGDVTINNGSGVNAVNIQDGGNTITIDGTVTATIDKTGLATDALQTSGNSLLSDIKAFFTNTYNQLTNWIAVKVLNLPTDYATSTKQGDGTQKTQIAGSPVNRSAYISFENALKIEEITRLCGVNFLGTTLDANFWTDGSANSGSIVQISGMVTLKTNTTANGAGKITSVRKGRYLFACPLIFRCIARFVTAGTSFNKRKMGVYDGSDGYYFQINGVNFSIGYQSAGGAESLVTSGSFNGSVASWTVDTNMHKFEIHYSIMKVEYYIDDVLIHTLVPTTSFITGVLTLPIWCENTNRNSSTSSVDLEIWSASIFRLGKEIHSQTYKNVAAANTYILKYGPGLLHCITLNDVNTSDAGTLTIYDNIAASDTKIATISIPKNETAFPVTLFYDVPFQIGLTIVTSQANNITICYE
jgi:hypothetical protein